ncbi:MAG: D-TA family PLP-dependent enzyme [Bacteroidota bacterium]
MDNWFEIENTGTLMSPALLFYGERIEHNIQKMIEIAGDVKRLRPHIKTHKCLEIIQLQMKHGINRFKCATLTEATLLAECGVKDVLIAYPLVEPMQHHLVHLTQKYPETRFSVLIDNESHVNAWNTTQHSIDVFIDVNVGMGRTGIAPEDAPNLLKIVQETGYTFRGWHVYDGHIRISNSEEQKKTVEQAFLPISKLLAATQTQHLEVICGGSISFVAHADAIERTLSPGTTLLWDYGYGIRFPDLPFQNAAVLLTRIISKPNNDCLCLDLGHKAVASEMQKAPVYFPQLQDAQIVVHSEEHLVLQVKDAANWSIGDVLYGIPYHICPTVALHSSAALVENKKAGKFWEIAARNRQYIHG